jgi:hypothetical protein
LPAKAAAGLNIPGPILFTIMPLRQNSAMWKKLTTHGGSVQECTKLNRVQGKDGRPLLLMDRIIKIKACPKFF